jgi:outer membrane biosynthesis protein TonB
MKLRLSLTLLLLITLAACGSPPSAAPTSAPEVKPTSVPPTQPPPTAVPPTNTSAPAATKPAPTKPPAPTDTTVPQPTDTATAAPATTQLRPTPTSAGPLTAAIYAANCRSVPTADKPGQIIVQISVEASGGNGRYRYFYQDKESPTKFIEVTGEKGTRLIGEVKVTSGDGQEIKKEFDIAANQLTCP